MSSTSYISGKYNEKVRFVFIDRVFYLRLTVMESYDILEEIRIKPHLLHGDSPFHRGKIVF